MNDYQIAAYVVSNALRAANTVQENPLDAGVLIQLSGTVSSAVAVYGVKNRKAIRKAALQVTPDFKIIAEDFFLALKETPYIASVFRSKEYRDIAEFVIRNKHLSAKKRVQLYREQYAPKSAKFWKTFRIICLSITLICTMLNIGLILFSPERRQQFLDDWHRMKEHAAKVRKYAKTFSKAVKFLMHQIKK